ncbi:MAG: hypothetical protein GXY79_02130 [Chloroflexi bacterium]|nr:hypothetical protein [Chloroflexota bacterium]
MIRDVVVRREAANRGITVTEQEVQTFLEKQFGFDRTAAAAAEVVATLQAETTATPLPTVALAPSIGVTATEGLTEGVELGPTATPVPTAVPMTEDEFAQASAKFFESIKQGVNMSEADFRHLLESALYQEKVETALKAEMPTTAEQVHARHILVATEEEANQVRERLAAGESFEELAKELSTDTGSGAAGGDLGWFVRGQMVEPFEEVAFSLAPGTISEPVQSQYGYHIIEVLAHEQNRSLEGSALQASQQAQLEAWYAERTGPDQVTRSWTPDVVPADPYTLQ